MIQQSSFGTSQLVIFWFTFFFFEEFWFFSNLKSAIEELETLFSKTFKLTLIRVFPFTMANLLADLTEPEKDRLAKLAPTAFTG